MVRILKLLFGVRRPGVPDDATGRTLSSSRRVPEGDSVLEVCSNRRLRATSNSFLHASAGSVCAAQGGGDVERIYRRSKDEMFVITLLEDRIAQGFDYL